MNTCFKETMKNNLRSLVQAIGSYRFGLIESHQNLLEEWCDYYTNDLQILPAFQREFTPQQQEAIRRFVGQIEKSQASDFDDIRQSARELLDLLEIEQTG